MEMLFEGISDEQFKQMKAVFGTIENNLIKISDWCQANGDENPDITG